jgi:hypothetical protein
MYLGRKYNMYLGRKYNMYLGINKAVSTQKITYLTQELNFTPWYDTSYVVEYKISTWVAKP